MPAGTQSGNHVRLRGKGMTVLRSPSRGDMVIEMVVETPQHLTKKQQELLREFEKAGDKDRTSPASEGFFSRMKEFRGRRSEAPWSSSTETPQLLRRVTSSASSPASCWRCHIWA